MGTVAPDVGAQQALVDLCAAKGLFRPYDHGPLRGLAISPAWLSDILAAARHAAEAHERTAGAEPSFRAGTQGAGPATNLPAPLTSFIGREQELSRVQSLVSTSRLVTLTGPGGSGKTRLAIETARALVAGFPDGIFFVDLAPLADPALIPSAVARVLGVQEQRGVPLRESLAFVLREKRLLLLLDNYEHLLAEATFAGELLQAMPAVSLLVTSRAPLRLSGEQEYAVLPLPVPDAQGGTPAALASNAAVRLFVARAQAVRSDFVLSDTNTKAVAAICLRLDGLPLAIELAAAWVRLLPPAALLARLQQRLPVLTGGARDVPARQKTLRDTIAWSYLLLEPEEQTLFRRLGVCAGSCTLEMAAAVCDAEGDLGREVLDGVSSLVEKSLLRASAGSEGEPRYGMLETVREYALEQLQANSETEAVRRHHARYLVDLAEEAEPWLLSGRRNEWVWRLDVEQENIRAALSWALERDQGQTGLRLVGALLYWYYRRDRGEGRRWVEALLRLPSATAPTAARGKALLSAASYCRVLGDNPAAQLWAAEAMGICRDPGDAGELARAQGLLGAAIVDDNPRALALLREGVTGLRTAHEPLHLAMHLNLLARKLLDVGDLAAAVESWKESVALFQGSDSSFGRGLSLGNLGTALWQHGDDAAARPLLEEAASASRISGDTRRTAGLLGQLSLLALWRGDSDSARQCLGEALVLDREAGNRIGMLFEVSLAVSLAVAAAEPERAARLAGALSVLGSEPGVRRSDREQAEYSAAVSALRAALGEEQLQAAWNEGQRLTLTEAVAEALKSGEEPIAPESGPVQ